MKILNRFTSVGLKSPKLTLFIFFISTIIFASGIAKMGSESSHRIWFKKNDPHLVQFDEFKRLFGNDDNIVLAYNNPKGIFSNESIKNIEKLTDLLWKTPNVIRVDSLTNIVVSQTADDEIILDDFLSSEKNYTEKELELKYKESLTNKRIKGVFVNKKNTSTIIFARLKPITNAVTHYNNSINHIKEKLNAAGFSNSDVYIAGTAPLNVSFRNLSMSDLAKILPLLVAFILGSLFFLFRSIKAVFFPLLEITFSILITMGIAGYLGVNFSMIISMVPCIIAAIALADTIHLMSAYKKSKSIDEAVQKVLMPTLLTTITTSFGFITLTSSQLKPIQDLGLVCFFGVFVAWFATFFLVAPLIKIFDIKLASDKKYLNANSLFNFVCHHYKKILFSCFALITISIFLALQLKINSNLLKYFDKKVDIRRSNEFLKKEFNGHSSIQIVFDSLAKDGIKNQAFLQKVDKLLEQISKRSHVKKISSLVDIIKEMNQTLRNNAAGSFIIPKNEMIAQSLFLYELSLPPGRSLWYWIDSHYQKLRVEIAWDIDDSYLAINEISAINKLIKDSGVSGHVTGKAALIMGLDRYIAKTFVSSFGFALLVMAIILMITFKSFLIGLLAMIPNVIPPIIGLGVLHLLGSNIDVGVVLIMSICLGIAVDDTIYFFHYLSNANRKNKDIKQNLHDLFINIGDSLIFTTLILCMSFLSFLIGQFKPNQNFGLITSVVLGLALFCDLLVLPSILLALERKAEKK